MSPQRLRGVAGGGLGFCGTVLVGCRVDGDAADFATMGALAFVTDHLYKTKENTVPISKSILAEAMAYIEQRACRSAAWRASKHSRYFGFSGAMKKTWAQIDRASE